LTAKISSVDDLAASNGGEEGRVFVRRICLSIPAAAAGAGSRVTKLPK